jgi:hypothetical protein
MNLIDANISSPSVFANSGFQRAVVTQLDSAQIIYSKNTMALNSCESFTQELKSKLKFTYYDKIILSFLTSGHLRKNIIIVEPGTFYNRNRHFVAENRGALETAWERTT